MNARLLYKQGPLYVQTYVILILGPGMNVQRADWKLIEIRDRLSMLTGADKQSVS